MNYADDDIDKVTEVYHNWRNISASFENVDGFCYNATIDEVIKQDYKLTPGIYVGTEAVEDDGIPFETKMADLTATLKSQMEQEDALNEEIKAQLINIGFAL